MKTTTVAVKTGFMLWFDLMLLLAALGPRPTDPEHGWNIYGSSWVLSGWVLFSFLFLSLSERAKPPAITSKVTTAILETAATIGHSQPLPQTASAFVVVDPVYPVSQAQVYPV